MDSNSKDGRISSMHNAARLPIQHFLAQSSKSSKPTRIGRLVVATAHQSMRATAPRTAKSSSFDGGERTKIASKLTSSRDIGSISARRSPLWPVQDSTAQYAGRTINSFALIRQFLAQKALQLVFILTVRACRQGRIPDPSAREWAMLVTSESRSNWQRMYADT